MKHKIHIPAHVIAKWEEMTERNDHTGVLWEIACFFSYANYRYDDFDRLADRFARILREMERAGCMTGANLKDRIEAYDELLALVIEGYGEEVWRKVA